MSALEAQVLTRGQLFGDFVGTGAHWAQAFPWLDVQEGRAALSYAAGHVRSGPQVPGEGLCIRECWGYMVALKELWAFPQTGYNSFFFTVLELGSPSLVPAGLFFDLCLVPFSWFVCMANGSLCLSCRTILYFFHVSSVPRYSHLGFRLP